MRGGSTLSVAVSNRKSTFHFSLSHCRHARDRRAGFHAQIVRAPQRALRVRRLRQARQHPGAIEQRTAFAHLGLQERFGDAQRFGPPHDEQKTRLLDRDAGLRRNIRPDVAGAPRALPSFAARLARDGDEAEIADRGAVGAAVALDDDDAFAQPRRRVSVRKSQNTRADDRQIVALAHRASSSR